VDKKGNTLMTEKYIKQLCREQKLYVTPELNDKVYLHYKGLHHKVILYIFMFKIYIKILKMKY